MLPVTFQFIIAMVAYAINEQLARRIEYLLEEVRVLREVYTETTGRKRIPFTDEQRRRLAIKGKALTPEEREACCQIARPSTILTWFRQLGAQKYDSSTQRSKPGRSRKATENRPLHSAPRH
jgi:putative transposase